MITILWAINSKCNYNCEYCYLNFSNDINPINNERSKYVSDLSLEDISVFIASLPFSEGIRVFIVGAEPLSYPKRIFPIIAELKKHNIQVVLCTNGYELDKYYQTILDVGIDAVSVSLDSWDKEYNDKYRQYPTGSGFEKVVSGISSLIQEKKKMNSKIKVGIYTVLTKINIFNLEKTFLFASDLGIDYFIYQPIFLASNHKFYNELVLGKEEAKVLVDTTKNLKKYNVETKLPADSYLELLFKLVRGENIIINNCFAGSNLFFITPEGYVHACPAGIKIQKEAIPTSIKDVDVFSNKTLRQIECKYCSYDCVNMWQLMEYDDILDL